MDYYYYYYYANYRKVFCDFGENFIVVDQDGKDRESSSIISISKEIKGTVTTTEPHDFQDLDWVKFRNIKGMTELNGKEVQIIKKSL